MEALQIILLLATLLCGLAAGLLLAFAIVVMPGIKRLNDHDYLQAFKSMDRVIQQSQPIFMAVWLGSVVMLVMATVWGVGQWDGLEHGCMVAAAALYLLGVQGPTAAINVPLNNRLQQQDLAAMTAPALREARQNFEPRWVRWNTIRTVFATLTVVLLLVVVSRL